MTDQELYEALGIQHFDGGGVAYQSTDIPATTLPEGWEEVINPHTGAVIGYAGPNGGRTGNRPSKEDVAYFGSGFADPAKYQSALDYVYGKQYKHSEIADKGANIFGNGNIFDPTADKPYDPSAGQGISKIVAGIAAGQGLYKTSGGETFFNGEPLTSPDGGKTWVGRYQDKVHAGYDTVFLTTDADGKVNFSGGEPQSAILYTPGNDDKWGGPNGLRDNFVIPAALAIAAAYGAPYVSGPGGAAGAMGVTNATGIVALNSGLTAAGLNAAGQYTSSGEHNINWGSVVKAGVIAGATAGFTKLIGDSSWMKDVPKDWKPGVSAGTTTLAVTGGDTKQALAAFVGAEMPVAVDGLSKQAALQLGLEWSKMPQWQRDILATASGSALKGNSGQGITNDVLNSALNSVVSAGKDFFTNAVNGISTLPSDLPGFEKLPNQPDLLPANPDLSSLPNIVGLPTVDELKISDDPAQMLRDAGLAESANGVFTLPNDAGYVNAQGQLVDPEGNLQVQVSGPRETENPTTAPSYTLDRVTVSGERIPDDAPYIPNETIIPKPAATNVTEFDPVVVSHPPLEEDPLIPLTPTEVGGGDRTVTEVVVPPVTPPAATAPPGNDSSKKPPTTSGPPPTPKTVGVDGQTVSSAPTELAKISLMDLNDTTIDDLLKYLQGGKHKPQDKKPDNNPVYAAQGGSIDDLIAYLRS